MSTSTQGGADPGGPATHLRKGALRALNTLNTCPLMPVDAFVHLAGLRSQSSAYQQLARLQCMGLADVRRVDPGYLVGDRRIGCWMLTEEGRRLFRLAADHEPTELQPAAFSAQSLHKRAAIRESNLPLLIASYRLLARLVLERSDEERAVDVRSWEWPWVRVGQSNADGNLLRVKMPGGATLRVRATGVNGAGMNERLTQVLIVPDLGTVPVVHYREMLRRLFVLRQVMDLAEPGAELEVVIATSDPDGRGTRLGAWLELLNSLGIRYGDGALRARVLTWQCVASMTRRRCACILADDRDRIHVCQTAPIGVGSSLAPARSHEQLLHLIGRHPFLTVDQLAVLLGTTVHRVKRLEQELIADGLLRRVDHRELPRGTTPAYEHFAALGLVEITGTSRRRLAAWLGVSPAAARRYHGVTANGWRGVRLRSRLLQTLAHTLGANGVFVAFALAAEVVRRHGGSDVLVEWRSAAGCERRRCKPDGYGCYVRQGVPYGFFLEYDRGTERAHKYAAKLRAYYSYRDSGQAAKDFDGFPTVLFVTTDAAAEDRMAEQAYRASFIRGSEALSILSTTTARIAMAPGGMVGPIWRVLGSASEDSACLRAWPTSPAFVAPTGPAQGHRSAGLGWSPLEWSPSCEGRGSLQMEGSNGLCA